MFKEKEIKNTTINNASTKFDYNSEENDYRIETLKEGMAPSAFKRGESDFIIVGNKFCRSFYFEGFPSYVSIGYLSTLYSGDYDVDVNLAIDKRQYSKVRQELQKKLTIVKAKYEEEVEKGSNKDRDTYEEQAARLTRQLAELASREESAYEVQLFFSLYADTKEELERQSNNLIQELKSSDLTVHTFALRQDKAWKNIVPYGIDYLRDKKRNFNTGAVISSVPFYIPELYDDYGVFVGHNVFTGSPALLDLYKKGIKNSNLNIFGASGSGKSTFVKTLTMRSSLHGIRSVIIDPEGEYNDVAKKLHGGIVKFSTNINNALIMNIFDVEEEEELDPVTGEKSINLDLRAKYEDVLGFFKVAYPEITKGEEAEMLEVIEELYSRFGFIDGDPDSLYLQDDQVVVNGKLQNNSYKRKVPKIGDFLDLLDILIREGTFPNLQNVYNGLQPYRASKTRGMFDTYTPDYLQKLKDMPVINFDVSSIESSEIRSLSMYVLLSWIWEKFGKKNPHLKKRIIVDEAWMMMAENIKGSEFTSDFLENMSRRIRKRNGALVIASQKVEDFANTVKGKAIISNAHTTFLLSHETSDKDILRQAFSLDPGVVDNVIEAEIGRVLIKQGSQLYLIQSYLFDNEKITATTNNG